MEGDSLYPLKDSAPSVKCANCETILPYQGEKCRVLSDIYASSDVQNDEFIGASQENLDFSMK
jgi:hypothetical protein